MLDALIERPKLEVVWKGKSYWRIFNVYIYIYSLSSCSLCVIRRGGQGETKPICHNPHTQHFRAFITVTAFMREDENVEATGLHGMLFGLFSHSCCFSLQFAQCLQFELGLIPPHAFFSRYVILWKLIKLRFRA